MRTTRWVAVVGAMALALSAAACGGDDGGDEGGSGNSNFAAGSTMARALGFSVNSVTRIVSSTVIIPKRSVSSSGTCITATVRSARWR